MQAPFDLLIRNASVVDGTGAPRFSADIGITGERIARIGDLSGHSGKVEIDLHDRIAAPGFIDAHTHDDRFMLSSPDMTPKVSQGVTTVIGGNCGVSLAPMPRPIPDPVTPPLNLLDDEGKWFRFRSFAAYLDALRAAPAATNCAMLVGHSTLRIATMDDLTQPATPAQIEAMRALVDEALNAGAIGVSTGLFYEPAIAAPTEEVIEVCRPLKAHNGLYCTHMRDEADHIVDSLEETFRIGREAGRAGGDLAPQAHGKGEPWPLEGNAGADQGTHGHADGVPGLLSVHRGLHRAVRAPRGGCVARDRELVEDTAASTRARIWPTSRARWASRRKKRSSG